MKLIPTVKNKDMRIWLTMKFRWRTKWIKVETLRLYTLFEALNFL